jgi:hypothetical protein
MQGVSWKAMRAIETVLLLESSFVGILGRLPKNILYFIAPCRRPLR